ncbi:lipid kinase, YegS/Rv2252/BmrU family [Halobacillus dabanensis]|uniref:Lipid kinase, YegS/Rv2252/BmrU family n=1 Tax=Halobacillus dabanensis TaxID=240302 RepID=A0A1I3NMU7_HALDA|nr:diacylglycerol kinase family protein [Halobacillus dabanensis]SFJ10482.1 lipid kinase, YegS/Rv2252/BmrU family [Halobacillus dabanensis]
MYIVIVNPEAGNGKAQVLFRKIQKDPLYNKANCRSFFTEGEGHAEKLARQVVEIHKETITAVVVIGGDGTLHEVVNGIINYPRIPISLIPAGSGNDFARGIRLKERGIKLFQKYIKRPEQFSVRLGRYLPRQQSKNRQRAFLNSIGFGLDGLVVETANNQKNRYWARKLRISKLTYSLALFRTIRRARPFQFELILDGKLYPVQEAMMVTITNHPYYGGGMKIAPKANIKNPAFYIMLVEPIKKKKLLALFFSVFLGQHIRMKEVRQVKASRVSIRSFERIPYQVDGQSGKCYDCKIEKAGISTTFYVD